MNRILVIRGGAIGDFILTLPALKTLRDAYPDAVIDILGYPHIAVLAENRFYANAIRSIEYGPLSRFFARGGELDPDLCQYFGSFDLIISYLFDPDGIFEANLRRSGAGNIITGPAKLNAAAHASEQLAAPLEQLSAKLTGRAAKVFPSADDRAFAREFLNGFPSNFVALHPGSGSVTKNWPLNYWMALGDHLLGNDQALIVVSGEADQSPLAELQKQWRNPRVRFATNLPLPHLAGVLANSVFVGHDSGVSHLAAAAGARCVVLFGPTDPTVWAPRGENVCIISAPKGDLTRLPVETVIQAVNSRRGGLQSAD